MNTTTEPKFRPGDYVRQVDVPAFISQRVKEVVRTEVGIAYVTVIKTPMMGPTYYIHFEHELEAAG